MHDGCSPRMAMAMLIALVLVSSAAVVSGDSDARKLDETTPGSEKCTPCTETPPPPPPPSPCPPPPALPPPPPPPAPPPPSPHKKPPPGPYCPPPPPSSYIYITGPPGSLYPIDQDFNGANNRSPGSQFLFLIGVGLLGLLGFW